MSRRVWIIGPIAWDIVLYVDQYPREGGFSQATRKVERPGGSAFNIAYGLATTGIDVGFIGYVGSDAAGERLKELIGQSSIAHPHITTFDGPTNSPLVVISPSGERTVIAQSKSRMSDVNIQEVPIQPSDIVVFPLWREFFWDEYLRLRNLGCQIVVGLGAADDTRGPFADLAIGSHSDFKGEIKDEQFTSAVITQGSEGSRYMSQDEAHFQEALPANMVDATGAGDAFIAGYLAGYSHQIDPVKSLRIGAAWASLAIESECSLPPHFKDVIERYPDVRL
jgi:ribokinase